MIVDFSDKLANEKILLISIIGTLEALKNGKISIAEAEKFLFSPHTISRLKEVQCNAEIIDILERGCELEDIASLLPERLVQNIDGLKVQALEELERHKKIENKFWLQEKN